VRELELGVCDLGLEAFDMSNKPNSSSARWEAKHRGRLSQPYQASPGNPDMTRDWFGRLEASQAT